MAQLQFGITGALSDLERLERAANESALKIQKTMAETQLTAGAGGLNTQQMTAQNAMAQTILKQGETQRQATLAESNAKIAKMEADAEYKRTATQAKASQARINAARVEKNEIETLIAATKLEGVETANKNMLANNIAAQDRSNQKAIAGIELTEARKQAVVDESNVKQVLSREKTDAAILQSVAKTQAQIENIESRTGINTSRAGVYDARSGAIGSKAAADIEAQNMKAVAAVEKMEAQKNVIVAQGEAKITTEMAKEELVRQRIVKESSAVQLATVRQQVEQEKLLYMQARINAFESKPTGMAGLMQRRMSWVGTGALVMGGMAGIGETVSAINQVEKGMTVIARVTEDAAFNFKGMRDELQQLGVTYGDTWTDVSDIAIKWAQAGYNQAETIELTKSSLLALNTAELDSTQATSGLIAIMAQWGLTTEELLPTIDKINKVADDYAVTSADLVAGLTRSSGAAKALGLDMNQTIAILTTMREATGRTGKEVGNALNGILSFMQRDKAIDVFDSLGIQVFADKARTQFNSVMDTFEQMAAKWPEMGENAKDVLTGEAEAAGLLAEEMAQAVGVQEQWSDMQQRDLSQAAAGIYRRNYLLALLQNWSKVD
ncbi:MAG: phage tail tape measure protein, partial [Bacteroidales bacterium]|nr:phage tail tape measure protein [Bacteroidales bacterium]